MKPLTWWFRVVGGYNVLLGAASLGYIAFSQEHFESGMPYHVTNSVRSAFVDAWFPFACDILIVGVALLVASKRPERNIGLAWLAIALEVAHGIAHNVFLIRRGYEAGGYIAFLAFTCAMVIWGVWAIIRAGDAQQSSEQSDPAHDPATLLAQQ